MIIAIILVVAAALSLAFMLWVAKGRSSAINRVEDLPRRIRPVDIQAFRVLVDPSETQFLWSKLPRAEFRRIQRQRLRAAVQYIACAAQNAAVLVRIGEAARHSSDPSVAAAGEKLVSAAIRLRIFSFQAMLKLHLEMILPGAHVSAGDLAESYERMTSLVFLLGRLQRPAAGISGAAL
jgi:hypothetical protein